MSENEGINEHKIENITVDFIDETRNSGIHSKNILVSSNTLWYFMLVNFWGLGQCVTIIGLVVNILNVITFLKQGVQDSVNISLLGLTISDLGSLMFLFLLNLCMTPPITRMDLPFYPHQIIYFLFWVHMIFTRVTTGTTAWIAFERCLCIVAPLKIKSIITPRRTIVYICGLYIFVCAAVAPMFYTARFIWIYDSSRNKSILGFVKVKTDGNTEGATYIANNILPILFFIFIVVCTVILVRALRSNAKWRKITANSEKATSMSNRDTKVVKLVLIISVVFIFCYAPSAVFIIMPLVEQELKFDRAQKNFVLALFSVVLHLESINAGANFFIYIKMSSKFRMTCQQLFCSHNTNTEHAQNKSH